jgi:hypothetical protein
VFRLTDAQWARIREHIHEESEPSRIAPTCEITQVRGFSGQARSFLQGFVSRSTPLSFHAHRVRVRVRGIVPLRCLFARELWNSEGLDKPRFDRCRGTQTSDR